jgi:PLP dependent protein
MTDLMEKYNLVKFKTESVANECGRKLPEIIAISKKQPESKIIELYRLGQRNFGENYVQELCQKAKAIREHGITDVVWHMVGHLQKNKIKQLLPWIQVFHGLDSLKLAIDLNSEWEKLKKSTPLSVFIQVNLDGESTKSGLDANEVGVLIHEVHKLSNLTLLGLMIIPAPEKNKNGESFAQLAKLAKQFGLNKLSMGMSDDYPLAIKEGATHLRLGTSIFGERIE